MKKKTPFLLVLAALSATALGLGAAGCGHEHTYETDWTRTETEHYHASTCGHDDKDRNPHDTDGANGACSVCGYSVAWKITYVSAHGTVPAAAENQIKLPDTLPVLSDSDYDFGGWYLDEACTEANKAVAGSALTGATTLYAKWTPKTVSIDSWKITYVSAHGTVPAAAENQTKLPDTLPVVSDSAYDFGGWYLDEDCTEANEAVAGSAISKATTLYAKWTLKVGATAENPVVLEGLSTYVLTNPINGKVYFKYTATKAGRYTVETVAFGEVTEVTSDDTNAKIVKEDGVGYHLTLAAGKSVNIVVSKGGSADTAKVSAVVNECVNEPLPAEGWEAGVYSELLGASLSIDFKADGSLTFNGGDSSRYDYVGGDVDTLKFISNGVEYTVKYSVKNGEKVLTLSWKNGSASFDRELFLEVEQVPVEIAKFSGRYEVAADGNKVGGISVINIYDDGTGFYIGGSGSKTKISDNGKSFYQKTNTLTWGGAYLITLNLNAAGEAESINVSDGSANYVYARTGDAGIKTPSALPLPRDDAEYRGEKYSIIVMDGSQLYKGFSMLDIDEFDGVYYTINYRQYPVEETVKVKVVDESGVISIEVYDLEGTKVDTLNKVAPVLHELTDTGEWGESIEKSAFEYDGYFYVAKADGAYRISAEYSDQGQHNVAIKYGVGLYDVDESGNDVPDSGVVNLGAGDIVKLICKDINADITFYCTKLEEGMIESKPFVIENGSATVADPFAATNYYFTYTAPKAGRYMVLCSKESYGQETYLLPYNINGTDCGYNLESWKWYAGFSEDKPYAVIDVPADNLTVKISVYNQMYADALNVLVCEAEESYTELVFDSDGAGTVTEGGAYSYNPKALDVGADDLLNDSDVIGVKFTCSSSMTVNALGQVKTGTEIVLTKKEVKFGFTIEFTGTVTYAIAIKPGSENNPYNITELGTTGIECDNNDYTYVTITAPADTAIKITLGKIDGENVYFRFGSESYSSGDYLAVSAGESATINFYAEGIVPVIVIKDLSADATELEFTDSTSDDGKVVSAVTVDVEGTQVYKITDTYGVDVVVTANVAFSFDYGDGVAVNATENEGVYSLIIKAGKDIAFKVTAEGALNFAATYPQGHAKNPLEITLVNGEFSAEIKETTSYVFSAAGSYLLGGSCSFALNGKSVSSAVTVKAGDVLTVSLPWWTDSGKFTISIAVPAEFKGKYTYGDTDGELTIGANTVTIGEKQYILTAVVGDVYTFTYTPDEGEAENVTLTLNADGLKIGNDTLTVKLMFTEAQAVEYTGSSGYYEVTYTLSLNQNGTGTFSEDYGYGRPYTSNIEVEETANGCYSFSGYTFEFDENGNIVLKSYEDDVATLYAPGNTPPPTHSEGGLVYSGDGITIIIPGGTLGNFVDATYSVEGEKYNITIYESVGYYEYEGAAGISGTFTVSDDGKTITLTEDETIYTLIKEEDETPAPSEEGTVYSNDDGITLTIADGDIGNFVDAKYFDGEANNDITIYEDTTPGSYTFDDGMNFVTGTITVIDENTIRVTDNWSGDYILIKQS